MHVILALLIAISSTPSGLQDESTPLPEFNDVLVIGDVASRGRRADHVDAIELTRSERRTP